MSDSIRGRPEWAGGRPPDGLREAARPTAASSRRYSVERKRELVELFERSGLKQSEFCRRHGLTPTSLLTWRRALAAGGLPGLEPKPNPRNSGKRRRARGSYSPEERRAAVEAFGKSELTLDQFARTWGVSKKTLSGWVAAVKREGPKALEPKPRRRGQHTPKGALPAAVHEAISRTKRRFPQFGLRRVRDWLARFGGVEVSTGTVRKTLSAQGLHPPPAPKRKPRRKRQPPRRFERARPGELWQSDITSFVLPRSGRRVYLIVFLDDFSRYVVSFGLHLHQKTEIATEALLDGIARFGKPKEVLTDQGRQYFVWRGKSAFQKLLEREGIRHVVSRTHHPQTLGKCERLWSTVGAEFWERVRPDELGEARERLGHYFAHYNFFRPHQGIDGLVPADRFFGAESAVREALQRKLSGDELGLALAQVPRQSVYLVGQIGQRRLALHGERGRLVVHTPDGGREELGYEELGMPTGEERSDADDGDDSREEAAGAADAQARELQERAPTGVPDPGAVAGGQPRREDASPQDLRGDPGVLAGSQGQGRGDGGAGGAGPAAVADQPASAVGYGGGPLEAAAREGEGTAGDGRPRERPAQAEAQDRDAGAPPQAGGGRDPDPARPASQPGRGGGQDDLHGPGSVGEKKAGDEGIRSGCAERSRSDWLRAQKRDGEIARGWEERWE
jgi:transposase InsO family protein